VAAEYERYRVSTSQQKYRGVNIDILLFAQDLKAQLQSLELGRPATLRC